MVFSCVVVGCTERFLAGSGLKFHRIPTDIDRRTKWLNAINRKDWTPSSSGDRVCGNHFISGAASNDPKSPDYVPSVDMGYALKESATPENKMHRYNRASKRSKVRRALEETESAASVLMELSQNVKSFEPHEYQCDNDDDNLTLNASTDSTLHDPCLKKITSLQRENTNLILENHELKRKLDEANAKVLSAKFGENYLKGDSKTLFYTGVPSYQAFVWLVGFCASILPSSKILSKGDILLLVLMKLRLNLVDNDIAYRFGISRQHVSDILNGALGPLAKKLAFLIHWTDKEDIIRHMPAVVKSAYRKCRVIIDCCEIFIERPGNLTARAMTWSNYKSHNTIKILVAISPVGAVTFVSKAFGGRVSDKIITQRSGFLQLLEFGDLVLADRGFLIGDELAACGAHLAIPSFTKGKSQLSPMEVETSRRLSRVRIHVERAIERLKNFKVLCTTMKMNLVPHADNIITICSGISNLHPKLV